VAAARNLLANAGVKGHDGAPFEYDGTPTMTIVGRNRSMPDSFLEPLFDLAGVEVRISVTSGPAKARRELDRLLDEEAPAICTVGAGWLD